MTRRSGEAILGVAAYHPARPLQTRALLPITSVSKVSIHRQPSRCTESPTDLTLVVDEFWRKQGLWLPFCKTVEEYFRFRYRGNLNSHDGRQLTYWSSDSVPAGGWTWEEMNDNSRSIYYNPITHAVRYISWRSNDHLWNKRVPFAKIQHEFVT